MHVLFIPSWYPRDPDDIPGSFFREQALMLAGAGCQVGVLAPSLASLRTPIQSFRSQGISVEMDGAVATWRGQTVNLSPLLFHYQARTVSRLTMRMYSAYVRQHGRPDILHVHSALLGGAGAMYLSQSEGIPYVISEHSTAYARDRISQSGLELARRIAARALARFAVSRPFARLMARVLGPVVGSWDVMPNAVESAFLQAPLPPGHRAGFRFLHVSLLDEKKNVASIIRAFAEQFRGRSDITIRIGGDGPTRRALTALSADLGVLPQVGFLGPLSRAQVRSELASCDAFVLSSRYETFGVVLIEALAMGRPVIATACGGPEDIVTPEMGLLVPTNDDGALGAAMTRMIRERAQFPAADLRRSCSDRFGPHVVTQRWISAYKAALAARTRIGTSP